MTNEKANCILVCAILLLRLTKSQTTQYGVARSIPLSDKGISGTPFIVSTGVSRLKCMEGCRRHNCTSFNFGENRCELHATFVCEGSEGLEARPGFRYYDVEVGDMIPMADTFRNHENCLTIGHCSPKCYFPTTTTTTIPEITTAVATTSTTSTTLSPSTTTTTTTAPTTSGMTALGPPGPGDVTYICLVNADCTASNSDCRNGVVCECVAGYSYHADTKSCVTSCPNGYGTTFTGTTGFYVFGKDLGVYNYYNLPAFNVPSCQQQCIDTVDCVSMEYDDSILDCYMSAVTKIGNEGSWSSDPFFTYWQRNCA
ncbi:uncharacterized protein LOC128242562 [Mya arenaria]|uniref:uncharacterized protein LOC128242562 n=1 Tax=Mya arenaria TaxID=6604 RepID=UPI0022E85DD4|nr:uncharacterized protein LOC128242562 [Mya arenaria]